MNIEAGEETVTGAMMMNIRSMAIGLATGDGPVVIGPDMGDGPNTENGLDTEVIAKTDTTATEDHGTDTDTVHTGQSMLVQARSATRTRRHGSSSEKASIHPDSPSSSPTTKT